MFLIRPPYSENHEVIQIQGPITKKVNVNLYFEGITKYLQYFFMILRIFPVFLVSVTFYSTEPFLIPLLQYIWDRWCICSKVSSQTIYVRPFLKTAEKTPNPRIPS